MSNAPDEAELASMVDIYRHDTHKLRRRAHGDRQPEFRTLSVNCAVPLDADRDAAALSRPTGEPSMQLEAHESHVRLSLITGQPLDERQQYSTTNDAFRGHLRRLLEHTDPTEAHTAWLHGWLPAVFNESVYYPYTSLKYHTLLTAALYDCYRTGASFDDLRLTVDAPNHVVPHRTVYAGDRFALRIDTDLPGTESTSLGKRPARSWATVWNMLPHHPLEPNHDRFDMVLDAQLRRIRSWSTALQYIEDYESWRPER